VLRATFRSLLARKLRLVLSAMAIVLGVSFVSGALMLTDTLGKVFDNLFVSVNEKTAVEVRGAALFEGDGGTTRAPIPAELVGRVRAVPGVAAVSGDVNGYAQLIGKDGKAYSPGGAPTFGQNYDSDPKLSPYTLRSGSAPKGPDQIAIDARTAEQTGYRVGDTVPVLVLAGRQDFRLAGVFGFGDNDNIGGASISAFAPATALKLLSPDGSYLGIRAAAEPGVDDATLRGRIDAALPPSVEVLTGTQSAQDQADEIKGFFGFFRTFLLVFAAVALFVGAFLIFNTFTILVAQRQRELALLRALGASRGQVTRSVVVESLVVGVLASAIGLGLGVLVAIGLQALVNQFGGSLPSTTLEVQTRTVVVSFVVGVGITLLAALLPARRAAAVPPVAAMRDAATPERSLVRGSVIGAVLLVAGAVVLAFGLRGEIALVGLGALLAFLGVAGLSPLLSRPVARALGRPLARAVPGRLGRLNAMRNPRRTASTAAALMIGLALVTAVSVLGASAKKSVETVVAGNLSADVIVQSSSFQGFPADVARVVKKAPGVGAVDSVRQDQAQVGSSATFVAAIDPAALGRSVRADTVAGDLDRLGPGRLLLSQTEAKDRGLSVGQSVPVRLARSASKPYTVAGIYADSQVLGGLLISKQDAQGFANPNDSLLLVTDAAGASTPEVLAAVAAATTDYPTVEALDREGFVKAAASQIDVVLAIISVLLALSILIAVLGIVNTLALSVIERTRELGLLRAVGLGRPQVRRMVRVEAVIVAIFGALLGIAVGAVLGVVTQRALADDGLEELAFPVGRLVIFVIVAGLAGVLAALLPARRAARLDVLQAISTT